MLIARTNSKFLARTSSHVVTSHQQSLRVSRPFDFGDSAYTNWASVPSLLLVSMRGLASHCPAQPSMISSRMISQNVLSVLDFCLQQQTEMLATLQRLGDIESPTPTQPPLHLLLPLLAPPFSPTNAQ